MIAPAPYGAHSRETVLDMWSQGLTSTIIADRLRLRGPESALTIVRRARDRGDPRAVRRFFGARPNRKSDRTLDIIFSIPSFDYFRRKASALGVPKKTLVSMLLHVIAEDDILLAILDDPSLQAGKHPSDDRPDKYHPSNSLQCSQQSTKGFSDEQNLFAKETKRSEFSHV